MASERVNKAWVEKDSLKISGERSDTARQLQRDSPVQIIQPFFQWESVGVRPAENSIEFSPCKSAIYESVGGVKRKNDLHLGRDVEGCLDNYDWEKCQDV
jgi:hypothetical protein